jgi:hypothetical protein
MPGIGRPLLRPNGPYAQEGRNPNMTYTPQNVTRADVVRESGAISQVYAWMSAGLLLTGAIAMFVANQAGLVRAIYSNMFIFWGLIIAEVGLVIFLGARIAKMSPGLATAMFLLYSALNGITLSIIFLAYTTESIGVTFVVTAGTFGLMSLYGYTTRRDLTSMGNFLIMGLIGFFIGTIVNIFWANSTLYWILTYGGIIVFIGLTAWDTQKIKRMLAQAGDEDSIRRVSILGALMLYLDFINLFLLLLRIFGQRR